MSTPDLCHDKKDEERVLMVLRTALTAAEEGRIESALDLVAIAYEDWYGEVRSLEAVRNQRRGA